MMQQKVFFGVFFWLHTFLQNNIETYVYLGICLQKNL